MAALDERTVGAACNDPDTGRLNSHWRPMSSRAATKGAAERMATSQWRLMRFRSVIDLGPQY
jgi:hypothetical protein